MARPRLGLIQHIAGDLYIQIRADSTANKALAKMVDDALGGKDSEKVLWFDKGGRGCCRTEAGKRGPTWLEH